MFWVAINCVFTAGGYQLAAGDGASNYLVSTALFRDPSSWYHIVCAYDSTQATADNRLRMYVNGVEITTWSTNNRSNITLNSDSVVSRASVQHEIGARSAIYSDCYLADVHLVDGQALDPTSFGEFSATTGVWMPKAYTGTYGTNGFHLDFADNSSNTATTLGKDTSGAGNNWTPNNLSVTAGAGNDSLVDVPTNGAQTDTGVGGEVRGNYATLNPVAGGLGTLSNGNLDVAATGSHGTRNSTIGVSSGKWYAEFNLATAAVCGLGITSHNTAYATWPDNSAGNYWFYFDGGTKYFYPGGGAQATSAGAPATGIWKIALDLDTGKCWIGTGSIWYDSAWNQTGNPSAGTNPTFSSLPAATYFMFVETQATTFWVANFGQRAFAYTAPSGFKALNTANLPAPLVTKPSTVMDVLTWTGNSASSRALTGLGFSPDFVWIKDRSVGYNHVLFDAVRGAGGSKVLFSNRTTAEGGGAGEEGTNYGAITSFDSGGFTVAPGAVSSVWVNQSSDAYVGWAWDAGSSTVTNTQGSITSQVRANASAGFSIVTYTSNGTNGATIGHGLGIAPQFVVVKNRLNGTNWTVGHQSLDATSPWNYYLRLNSTNARAAAADFWNNTAPTSSVLTLGTSTSVNSIDGDPYVAYCFAPVAGYSSFGSYVGNGSGSNDGPFVYTGFRPKWVMVKASSSDPSGGGWWNIIDATRNTYNVATSRLGANSSSAENSSYQWMDLLSNGFKLRELLDGSNVSGVTYIYAAFAESPFAANNRAR
jgi:hypothetical protein